MKLPSYHALRPLAFLLIATALSACATRTPAPARPAALPSAYTEAGTQTGTAPSADWWRGFSSDELSALIATALEGNPDLVIAAERVRQAEAQVTIAGASLFPSLSAGAGASRRDTHGNGAPATSTNAFNASLSASYEVDLWGQNTSAARSADFALRASRYDRETVRLTLVSGVASAYFQLLSLRGRLALAQENITLAERVFKVVSARERNGAASPLDLARQQSTLLGQQATILPLQVQERQVLHALAILTGQAPQGFVVANASLLNITIPDVAPGLPSSLLVRRPDLASAEAQLSAANANVAAARAALLPSISLTGSAGISSATLSGLVNTPSIAFTLGASLLQTIFDAGRLKAQVAIAASRERELVLGYRKAILAALADVENALVARTRLNEQEQLLTLSLQQAKRGLQLAEVRYREGADDLIVLLDAQRTLSQAQDQVAQLRQSRLQATLDLFKALGGGWTQP